MELSEAKEILKDMEESMEQGKKDITIDSILKALEDSVKAIDTVLKALDNSISKDEVKRVYEDYAERIRYYDDNNIKHDDTYYEYVKICDVLLELLGEKII